MTKQNLQKIRKKEDGTQHKNLENTTKRIDETPMGALSNDMYNQVHKVMDTLAKKRSTESALEVERLLKRVIDERHAGNMKAKATTVMYTMAIDAWAKSGDPVAAQRAEQILQLMESEHRKGNKLVKPDGHSYTAVIKAWANSNAKGAAERAENLVTWMEKNGVKPNTACLNAVLDAWAKSREPDAERAEKILNRMLERADPQPDTISFNAVLNAWAKSGEKGAARKAENILETMHELHKAGHANIKPNVVSYTTVLDAWAKSKEKEVATNRAEAILKRMEKLYLEGNKDAEPNNRTYNAVINTWANSGIKGAAEKAEAILAKMMFHNITPNTVNFNAVIDAWAKSREKGAAQRADKILKKMITLYKAGNENVKPNNRCFNTVVSACAYSACAYTAGDREEKQKAFLIAFEVFNDLRESKEYGTPNSITYGTFVKACANLMPDGEQRKRVIEAVFKQCIRDGQVSEKVLSFLHDAIPSPELNLDHLGIKDVKDIMNIDVIPPEWKCNVKENKRYQKR